MHITQQAKDKYISMYPHMIDEEIPDNLAHFCEFIIQQNAGMADKYFKRHPEIAEAFLAHFKPTNGKVFYRGGHPNLDRVFLCTSDNKNVAMNFARHGNNSEHHKLNEGNGVFMSLTSELYYKTDWEVDNEREVFLWKARFKM